MKIALFGGTFDPVHYGHLRLAEEVREVIGFTSVLFMPAAVPPHKLAGGVTPVAARLDMLSLALSSNPFFEVSDMEAVRCGSSSRSGEERSYTIDTVQALLSEFAGTEGGVEISLIVGSDSFNEITTWYGYEQLLELVNFVVVARPGYAVKKIEAVLPVVPGSKFWYDDKIKGYRNESNKTVRFLLNTLLDISSSHIKELIRAGRSVKYLLPPDVIEYIKKEGLYV